MATDKVSLKEILQLQPKLTPMMEQYVNIKKDYWGTLMFYRMGDFYELFFEDAIKASTLLNITLTHRGHIGEFPIPMAGVPIHAASNYINRLNQMGEKVVICEQITKPNPDAPSSIVERKVVQVTSSAFPFDVDQLISNQRPYVCAAYFLPEKNNTNKIQGSFSICFLDFTTGEFFGYILTQFEDVLELLQKFSPKEFLAPLGFWDSSEFSELDKILNRIGAIQTTISSDYFSLVNTQNYLKKIIPHFNLQKKDSIFSPIILMPIGALSYYIHTTQPIESLKYIQSFRLESFTDQMQISMNTLVGLEILPRSKDKQHYQNSLLGLFDCTKTPQGSRRMQNIFENPTRNRKILENRFAEIEYFCKNHELLQKIRNLLIGVSDLDRICAKLCTKKIRPNDLFKISHTIGIFFEIYPLSKEYVSREKSNQSLISKTDLLSLKNSIEQTINSELDASLENGNLILPKKNLQRDKYAQLRNNSLDVLKNLEEKYKNKLSIVNLKIKYNNVHGYFIEVSNSHLSKVPKAFTRKQTLTNCERYTTGELEEFEKNVYTAKEKLEQIEQQIYEELIASIVNNIQALHALNVYFSQLDSVCAFAQKSLELNLNRPTIASENAPRILEIEKAFHPIVKHYSNHPFVEHCLKLDASIFFGLISGPNMSGKTTLMREIAIIIFLAQIGCFVPAKKANISLIDHLFSRIGANDNISQGQSTFMVEMMETASILQHATENSFIILDELGRGTSTFDGVALAGAIMEHITKEIKSFCLFSTHYHELIPLAQSNPSAKNLSLESKIEDEKVEFLYHLIEQGTPQSYGIYVAKLAAIPDSVLACAKQMLMELENKTKGEILSEQKKSTKAGEQLGLFDDFIVCKPTSRKIEKIENNSELKKELLKVNPMNITPMQALEKIISLQSLVQ